MIVQRGHWCRAFLVALTSSGKAFTSLNYCLAYNFRSTFLSSFPTLVLGISSTIS